MISATPTPVGGSDAGGFDSGSPRQQNTIVVVQQEWNGWRTAMAHLTDLEDIQWLHPAGAVRPIIHAQVRCDRILSGAIRHDCIETSAPHYLDVWVLKCHTAPSVFDELSRRAGAAAATPFHMSR